MIKKSRGCVGDLPVSGDGCLHEGNMCLDDFNVMMGTRASSFGKMVKISMFIAGQSLSYTFRCLNPVVLSS